MDEIDLFCDTGQGQGLSLIHILRHIHGGFFEGLRKRAEALEVGEGLHIIQTFEPHPLYAVMEGLGYEHYTEQRGEAEFHVWFCRVEKKEGDGSAPFKPLALLNYPMIDEKLGQIAVDFWETTWQSEKRVLPYETRLLLSLTNAVGAGRMRQAARELVKAYIHGVESAALDDVFELLAWNQGCLLYTSGGRQGAAHAGRLLRRLGRLSAHLPHRGHHLCGAGGGGL